MSNCTQSLSLLGVLWIVNACSPSREATRAEATPVIDVHVHAGPVSAGDAPPRDLVKELDEYGVVVAILGGPPVDVERTRRVAPKRIIGSIAFPCTAGRDPNLFACFASGANWPEIEWLRREVEEGRVGALGELYNVYAGISPADARMLPYFDLAAEHDLLVLAHAELGPPPPGRVPGCCPEFDGSLGHPALYEVVLSRHPQLRLILLHVFRPEFVQEAIQLMHRYPNVMVETSPMTRVPTELVYAALQTFVDEGFGDRIVFGSDYGGAIGGSLDVIESATFLSASQKRAILYDNAARMLRIEQTPPGRR